MSKKKTTITGEALRLEIQQDGNSAGVYQGSLLVVGFKWRESLRVFEPIAINQEWEDLILKNRAFQYYLNAVIESLRLYRIEASKLASLRGSIQSKYSDFLSVGK